MHDLDPWGESGGFGSKRAVLFLKISQTVQHMIALITLVIY